MDPTGPRYIQILGGWRRCRQKVTHCHPSLGRTMSVRRPPNTHPSAIGGTPLWGLISTSKHLPSRIMRAQGPGQRPTPKGDRSPTLRVDWRPFSRPGVAFPECPLRTLPGHELPRTLRDPEFSEAGSNGSKHCRAAQSDTSLHGGRDGPREHGTWV